MCRAQHVCIVLIRESSVRRSSRPRRKAEQVSLAGALMMMGMVGLGVDAPRLASIYVWRRKCGKWSFARECLSRDGPRE